MIDRTDLMIERHVSLLTARELQHAADIHRAEAQRAEELSTAHLKRAQEIDLYLAELKEPAP